MIDDFIVEFAKLLVKHPEDVRIKSIESDGTVDIVLYANHQDVGKLIGKEGRMIGAMKTFISGCKAKNNLNYRINIESV